MNRSCSDFQNCVTPVAKKRRPAKKKPEARGKRASGLATPR
jgi:hypothetical protein